MGDTVAKDRPHVLLFTDGACIGNPGPGGWAFILQHPASGRSKESSGGEHGTTNNRMEILGVIRGLEALKTPSRVKLFSDSEYVIKSMNEWMAKWKRFGWTKGPRRKKLVRNADLWQRLDELIGLHEVTAQWIRGHNGHPENERCDVLATSAAAVIAATPPPADFRPPTATPKPSTALGGLFSDPTNDEDEADE